MEPNNRTLEEYPADPSPECITPATETGLEGEFIVPTLDRVLFSELNLESILQLRLNQGESYPERLDQADCIYYLRTGLCGYGAGCRFNHPRDRITVIEAARPGGGEHPERVGQPVCQYYMRTGDCKYGASCKYHHPREGGRSVNPVLLNYLGFPLRPGEKECSYYARTGHCKFAATCKFHHAQPEPSSVSLHTSIPAPVQSPAFYPMMQSPSVSSSQQYGVVVARPSLVPCQFVQGPYGPVMFSPGMVPFPGWSPYSASMGMVSSHSTQSTFGPSSLYGLTQPSLSTSPSAGPYNPLYSPVDPLSDSQNENRFPERPGQPECQHYLRTGDCKFGYSCRYHHPPEKSGEKMNVVLSPIGLPLRPGTTPCTHFVQRGVCKFGPACRFDHPIGTLPYSSSASSITDIPVLLDSVGSAFSMNTELKSGGCKDSVLIRESSSIGTSNELVSSTLSKSEPAPVSSAQQPGQSSGPSTSISSTESHAWT